MVDDFDRPNPWRKGAVTFLILLVLGIPLAFAAWSWLALTYVYSHGERAGYVQKISKRGWVFKTWEGEIAMANLPGTMPQIFNFTVRDENIAHQIEKTMGQRVSIAYEQHRGLPGTFLGETQYFVTRVATVNDPYQMQTKPQAVPEAANKPQ